MAQGETQVLEFELGSETYCVEIDYVAEVVENAEFTDLPNAQDHVEGVMDLRGRTTSIINPRRVLGLDGDGERRRIIVFDPAETAEDTSLGWVVDEVQQVVRIDPGETDPPPSDDDAIRGIVQRNGKFVIWVDPDQING